MHEQSETIERDGKFFNVYGRETKNAGLPLPGEPAYDTMEEAVAGAKRRSDNSGGEGIVGRAMKAIPNVFDALHPNGTGVTKRGFTDIYPSK